MNILSISGNMIQTFKEKQCDKTTDFKNSIRDAAYLFWSYHPFLDFLKTRTLSENQKYQKYLWNVCCVARKKPIGREKGKPKTVALK